MPHLTDVLFVSAIVGGLAWMLAFAGQLVDLVNSLANLASAKDVGRTDRSERRLSGVVWSIAGAVALVVGFGFSVQLAAYEWIERADPIGAVFVLLVLLIVAAAAGLGIVAGLVRGEGLSYAVLRANLADDASARLRTADLAVYRTQLNQIDARRRHIRFGLRDRAGLRAVRVRLDGIADQFAVVPPTGFGAIGPVRWKTANAYLWRGNPVRLVPAILAGLLLIDLVILIVREPWGMSLVPAAIAALVALAVSLLLAILESRVALAAKAAWHAVYQRQRLDAVRLLEDLERSSRKGVAGLGDRVTRALQILRDQQS